MSDSDNTNELDNYGVWVKKPPRTVDSSADNTEDPFGSFDITTDLPDFSELDTTETKTNTTEEAETMFNDNSEEEISLDEFLTNGEFETGPDEDKIKQKEAERAQEEQSVSAPEEPAEEDVSLDSFIDTSTFDESEEVAAAPEPQVFEDDDDTLNIDLSFEEETPALGSQSVEVSAPVFEESASTDDGTESIDLSEFGITEFTDPNPTSEEVPAQTETQEVKEESFDDLFNDVTETGTTKEEEIDLSAFDVDFGSEEEPNNEPEVQEQVVEESVFEEPVAEEPVFEETAAETTEEVETTSFAEENDSDFDLDDIMNNVQDEDGRTVTVGSQEEALIKEVDDIPEENTDILETPEITSETIADFSEAFDQDINNTDIPDTFDEDASLTADELSNIASSVVTTENAAEEVLSDNTEITSEPAFEEEPQVSQPSNSDSTMVANSILQDIVGQLDALRSEISNLKSDFMEMKNNSSPIEPISIPTETTDNDDGGFFSSTDDDETIALSTDELNNILNTTEIIEETVQDTDTNSITSEPMMDDIANENTQDSIFGNVDIDVPEQDYDDTSDLSMDFSNDNLVEPELDEFDIDQPQETISDELPEEISISKTEDILVDSSSTDLMETSEEATPEEEILEISDEVVEDLSGDMSDLAELDEDEPETDLQEEIEEEVTEDLTDKSFEDIFAPDPSINESLTEDKLSYLENDANSQIELSSVAGLDNSNNETESESSIPGELKSEIKSVLSYMDQLLENLPEEKIAEFAQSEQFETYKKLFKELGLS